MENPDIALDTLVREELGLDPRELGSPWGAAFWSFLAFAIGALIPVLPFLFGSADTPVVIISALLSAAALFGVGVGVSLFTGRSALYSGARQVGLGAAAAAVTFIIGRIIGVSTDV
jgi:VIT1/CCC1 family predicted Fe2+/Mn2+ transporter